MRTLQKKLNKQGDLGPWDGVGRKTSGTGIDGPYTFEESFAQRKRKRKSMRLSRRKEGLEPISLFHCVEPIDKEVDNQIIPHV